MDESRTLRLLVDAHGFELRAFSYMGVGPESGKHLYTANWWKKNEYGYTDDSGVAVVSWSPKEGYHYTTCAQTADGTSWQAIEDGEPYSSGGTWTPIYSQ